MKNLVNIDMEDEMPVPVPAQHQVEPAESAENKINPLDDPTLVYIPVAKNVIVQVDSEGGPSSEASAPPQQMSMDSAPIGKEMLKEGSHSMMMQPVDQKPADGVQYMATVPPNWNGQVVYLIPGQGYTVAQVPGQTTMPKIGDDYRSVMGPRTGLFVKQTMKGCCCNYRNEFTIHEFGSGEQSQYENSGAELMFAAERGGCCLRCLSHFAPGFRPTSFDVWCGSHSEKSDADRPSLSEILLTNSKACTFGQSCWIWEGDGGPVRCPCCCNLPYFETKDANGTLLGRSQYICDMYLCVPKYEVLGAQGEKHYRVRPDVCCGGCLPYCQCGGVKGRCCAIPFYIRKPDPPFDALPGDFPGSRAEITNLFSGHKECCNRQNYALRFPVGATPEQKATLLGTTFLIEMLQFEQDQA